MVKPRIDVTSKGHFAIWESGRFNPSTGSGFAVIVSGPNGEMLKSFYDKDPSRYNHHFLFPANLDMLIATANVSRSTRGMSYTLELRRVIQLQKHEETAECLTELVWALHGRVKDNKLDLLYPALMNDQMRNMVEAAWKKATSPHTEQKLFWGYPRDKTVVTQSVRATSRDEFGEPNYNR